MLQTHLFEDRVLKASGLRVGTNCVVGAYSVVLYDSTLQEGAQLEALSLLMTMSEHRDERLLCLAIEDSHRRLGGSPSLLPMAEAIQHCHEDAVIDCFHQVQISREYLSGAVVVMPRPSRGKCFAGRVARSLSRQVHVLSHAAQPHSLLRDSRRGRQHLRRRTTAELGLVLELPRS